MIDSSFGKLTWRIVGFGERQMTLFVRFLRDETAATAIEYGLIAACIALAIITSVKGVSNNLKSTFNNVATNLR
jgi:pilus assembly protein Flp/PilA